jgi:hypothetical protein
MLELRANIEAATTAPGLTATQLPNSASKNVLPTLEEASRASRMIAMWRTHSKEQEDRIEALTRDVNSLLKETNNKSLIIAE